MTLMAALDPDLRRQWLTTCGQRYPAARLLSVDVLDRPGGIVLCGRVGMPGHQAMTDVLDVEVEDGCLSCLLVEEVAGVIRWLAGGGSAPIVVALPVGCEAGRVAAALAGHEGFAAAGGHVVVAQLVLVVAAATAVTDLLGDDLLAERHLAWGDADRRSVGEVLARSIDAADRVVATGTASEAGAELLGALAGERLECARDVHAATARLDLRRPRRPKDAVDRLDPRAFTPPRVGVSPHVWTVDLESWRPMHPSRLWRRLPELGGRRTRGRGRFWLPTRPSSVCAWDNAGAQLSIGDGGDWQGLAPSTRLVITGVDAADLMTVVAAFEDCLMTDTELVRGLASWVGRDDGFDAWLGAPVPTG